MPDYKNSKIYKIVSLLDEQEDFTYYGSTTQPLSNRFNQHKQFYKQFIKYGGGPRYSSFKIFDKFGLDSCQIVLIKEVPCETFEQLKAHEYAFIKMFPCINKSKHQTKSPDYNKNYHMIHKERIKEHKLKNNTKYYCYCCDYGCYNKFNFNTHKASKLHENNLKDAIDGLKNI